MDKKDNKPQIRFNGFTDPWEQRKLEQLADIIGGGTPSTSVSNYWDGDIDWYSPAEISDQIFVNSSQRKITLEGFNNSSSRMLPIGTVLFTSRAGIGKSAILLKPGCTNQGFQSISPKKNELDSYFIFTRTKELKQYGEKVGAGSTFVEVSGKQMAKLNIKMPSSLEEQKTIGKLFSNIDNLITLHQRKLDKLKIVKKSLLDKMFPQTGKNTPEIRFKKFTEPWEQRKWLDTVDISTKMVDPTCGKYDDLPHVAPGNIESFSGRLFDNIKMVKDEKLISGKFCFYAGDIIYGKINPQLGKYAFAKFKGLTSADAYVLNSKNGLTQKFLFTLIQTQDFYRYTVSVSRRSGIPKINRNELNSFNYRAPYEPEQKQIGGLLLSIDNLITLHQRQLDKLKNIKKAMLDKMFV